MNVEKPCLGSSPAGSGQPCLTEAAGDLATLPASLHPLHPDSPRQPWTPQSPPHGQEAPSPAGGDSGPSASSRRSGFLVSSQKSHPPSAPSSVRLCPLCLAPRAALAMRCPTQPCLCCCQVWSPAACHGAGSSPLLRIQQMRASRGKKTDTAPPSSSCPPRLLQKHFWGSSSTFEGWKPWMLRTRPSFGWQKEHPHQDDVQHRLSQMLIKAPSPSASLL